MKLLVLGGGESGVGAALLGEKLGYEVYVSDKGELKEKYKDVAIEEHTDPYEDNSAERAGSSSACSLPRDERRRRTVSGHRRTCRS